MVGVSLLNIQQTYGQIGIDIQPAELSIQQPKATMEITIDKLDLGAHTEPLQVHIDQSECWAERGLKPFQMLNKELAQRSYQDGIEDIGKIAEDGDRMAAIENGGNPIADIAAEITNPPPDEYNIAMIPTSRPKIEFTGGVVHFNVKPAKVNIDTHPNKPIIEATSPEVNISMKVWPQVIIEYTGPPNLFPSPESGTNLNMRW